MLEGGKIDGRQATFLLITIIVSEGILFMPATVTALSGQDGWLSILAALPVALGIGCLWVALGKRFPGKTPFEYTEIILGRVLGKIMGCIYFWGWIEVASHILREYTSLLNAVFMPETPLLVFVLLGAGISLYATYSGLETIVRINQIFMSPMLIAIVLIFLLDIPQMNINNLLPVYDSGFLPIIKGTFAPVFYFGHLILLSFLIPYLNRPQESFSILLRTVLACWLFFEISVVGSTLVFGPAVASVYYSPVLSSARMVHLANFLERLEVLLMIAWLTGGLIKISINLWVAALGLAQLLKLKSHRPLIIPVGLLVANFSILFHSNFIHLFDFITVVYPFYAAFTYLLLFPAGLLLIAVIRGLKEKPQ